MTTEVEEATARFGNLNRVRVRHQPLSTYSLGDGVWTSNKKFRSYLCERYGEIEAVTYAIDDSLVHYPNVRRLMFTVGTIADAKRFATFFKKVVGVHAKVYFGINDYKVQGAYIGSMNLVHSNSIDMMVRMPHRELYKWFESLWDSVKG